LLPHRAWQDTILVNFHAAPLMGIVAMLVSWVFLPAVGLLLGAAPFLRKHRQEFLCHQGRQYVALPPEMS
jgi:hypothetical protein